MTFLKIKYRDEASENLKFRDLIVLQTKLWKFGVSKEYLKIGIRNNN